MNLLAGLLPVLLLCLALPYAARPAHARAADAQTTGARTADAAPAPRVVTITGKFSSDLRPYAWYLPGLREFRRHRALAPSAELRFALVTDTPPMKPLLLAQARLEKRSFWGADWTQDLAIDEDGWFTLPESEEAERRRADVVISRRKGAITSWMLDVHTPGLGPAVYRLGDLRLECRVYLAIEWGKWRGRRVMGQVRDDVSTPPINALCGGPASVFFNTRPWPRLRGYVLREGERMQRRDLHGLQPRVDSFLLDLGPDGSPPPWSDDALVEFVFYDNSHWARVPAADAAP